MRRLASVLIVPAVLATPLVASAQAASAVVGVFNIFVGVFLSLTIFTYGIGLLVWVCRLGTWPTYRTEGVKIMEWSVVMLFVLLVLLAIVQFIQKHSQIAYAIISIIVVILIIWLIVWAILHWDSGKKKEERGNRAE